LPGAFPNGEVKGICARGGFEIDITWKNGELQQLRILSKAGRPAALRYKGKVINLSTTKNTTYTFDGLLNKA
jgi:alpha-L-fucosidase 2